MLNMHTRQGKSGEEKDSLPFVRTKTPVHESGESYIPLARSDLPHGKFYEIIEFTSEIENLFLRRPLREFISEVHPKSAV
jgi:hypothetical protein